MTQEEEIKSSSLEAELGFTTEHQFNPCLVYRGKLITTLQINKRGDELQARVVVFDGEEWDYLPLKGLIKFLNYLNC